MKKFYLLIYSKFSSHSKDLIELLYSVPNISLNFLSIDNTKTRKRILNDKTLNITKVPTLLIVSELTGVLQKFEGNQAFVYFHTVLAPPPPPPTPSLHLEENHTDIPSSDNDVEEIITPNHTIIDPENHTVIQQDNIIDNLIDEDDNVTFIKEKDNKKDEKKVSLIAQATAMQKLRLQEDEMMKKTR